MRTTILGVVVKKETEKALQITALVSWNGNTHYKDIWMPKSLVTLVRNRHDENQIDVEVEDWFCDKVEKENHYGNYRMIFETRC